MLTLLKSPRACALFILLSATGCGEPEPEQTSEEEALIFVEVARELGVSFRQSPGEHPDFPLPASMGGGVALFDADADGLLSEQELARFLRSFLTALFALNESAAQSSAEDVWTLVDESALYFASRAMRDIEGSESGISFEQFADW